jgi:putative glycosyltransferase (TIGR04372 family)
MVEAARLLNLIFRADVRFRRKPTAHKYFEALFRAGLFDRIASALTRDDDPDDFMLNRIFGVALVHSGQPETARRFLSRAAAMHRDSYFEPRMIGRTYLIEGNYDMAKAAFRRSAKLAPPTLMAHQNYAGRYEIEKYAPKTWEQKKAGELLIYDNLCQLAEDKFLAGAFEESFKYYQDMLNYQKQLNKRNLPKPLLDELRDELRLDELGDVDERIRHDRPTRILAYEWVTQFGHIGLLDSHYKMIQLGMRPAANYVILAPPNKVANKEYLSYWDQYYTIVQDPHVVNELFPYQRYFGENFMAYPSSGRLAEPWTRAAARAQIAWAQMKRPALLELKDEHVSFGRETLRRMGVPESAWYVGLHVREAGFHGEQADGMNEHRNARVQDYFDAIEAITSEGGIVIRLGDPSMNPLPKLRGVIDYARSELKSERMDLFLMATCRFIIGTTSGLTTAALSFGTPMLLANCISSDWQLWTAAADFIPKKIYSRRDKRCLSLAETCQSPVQDYLINNNVLERRGYFARSNSPDEILNAVKYKLGITASSCCATSTYSIRAASEKQISIKYRQAISNNPYMFGAAHPVTAFLEANPELLTPPVSHATRDAQWPTVKDVLVTAVQGGEQR